MLRIETGLVVLSVVLAFACPNLGSRWFNAAENRLSKLARHRRLCVLLVGFVALALRAIMLPFEPIPEPIVHDEFGYLLAADTFAHGRLTNPTPPLWEHFETFHVMFHPTYASIYPPAQGLILAAGKIFAGEPFVGVWLSVGMMCAAITWMLQAWLAPEWALLGGVLAILRYGVFGYWANSYWGGAVAAIGGALALGALPRIKQSQRIRDVLILGVGLAILANSRPYEGFIFSLPIAVLLVSWLLGKKSPSPRITLRRVVLPLTLVLMLTTAAMGYYFWRVTGNPVRMPYQVERATYAVAPYMIWQPVRAEPTYHHAVMRKMFVEEEMLGRRDGRSIAGVFERAYLAWSFFLGPALAFPLLMLLFDLPRNLSFRDIDSRTGILLLILITFAVGSLLVNFYSAHYSAPATGLILALVLVALRQLRHWGRAGAFMARALPVVCIISFAIRAGAAPLHLPLREFFQPAWYQQGPPSFGRAEIQRALEQEPGNQLVIVRYTPSHRPFKEWVYNEACIDCSKVVWARDMDPSENRHLQEYFKNRQVWLLEADEKPPRLTPYISFTPALLEQPRTQDQAR
jgi:hypothetical protein